ncbi:MAG: glycosyltransferase [Miltoncostaeaceae bacterium]
MSRPPRRVLRVIGRLNVGGPAIQAITLSDLLAPRGYETLLVRGAETEREGTMDHLAEELGVKPRLLAALQRELDPLGDLRATLTLRKVIRRERPDVLHTHTAKAGTVGRAAAFLSGRRRPRLVVHTFHGHVLSGYFSARRERFFAATERFLARHTDVLVAVSHEVRRDLLERGIGRPEQILVIPLGFDLSRFDLPPGERERAGARMRRELGVPRGAPLVTVAARMVPIKRLDVFLEAARMVANARPDVHFCLAGDGELHAELRRHAAVGALGTRLSWPGFVRDTPGLYAASDLVMLTSDNEGTPVSLIEALASGVPVVATDVGGVPTVVRHGDTGLLAPKGDAGGLAREALRVLGDAEEARRLAAAGRTDALARFHIGRLVDDIDGLYEEGLSR